MLIKNINVEHKDNMSAFDVASDVITNVIGSWYFILVLVTIINIWLFVNTSQAFVAFDPYPYQFFNLSLGIFSVLTASLIMMSQNRQATKDHLVQDHAFELNVKTAQEMNGLFDLIHSLKDEQVQLIDDLIDKIDIVIVALAKIEEYEAKKAHPLIQYHIAEEKES
jgi:uncharacterized membrane protein